MQGECSAPRAWGFGEPHPGAGPPPPHEEAGRRRAAALSRYAGWGIIRLVAFAAVPATLVPAAAATTVIPAVAALTVTTAAALIPATVIAETAAPATGTASPGAVILADINELTGDFGVAQTLKEITRQILRQPHNCEVLANIDRTDL